MIAQSTSAPRTSASRYTPPHLRPQPAPISRSTVVVQCFPPAMQRWMHDRFDATLPTARSCPQPSSNPDSAPTPFPIQHPQTKSTVAAWNTFAAQTSTITAGLSALKPDQKKTCNTCIESSSHHAHPDPARPDSGYWSEEGKKELFPKLSERTVVMEGGNTRKKLFPVVPKALFPEKERRELLPAGQKGELLPDIGRRELFPEKDGGNLFPEMLKTKVVMEDRCDDLFPATRRELFPRRMGSPASETLSSIANQHPLPPQEPSAQVTQHLPQGFSNSWPQPSTYTTQQLTPTQAITLGPSKSRPETTDAVARRIIASGLGIRVPKRTDTETQERKEEMEQRRMQREERERRGKVAIWQRSAGIAQRL